MVLNIFLSALGGVFLALAFPRYELVFLTFLAFIPYFFVLEKVNFKKAFLYGTLFGWVAYLLSHTWIAFTIQEFGGFSKPLAILTYILFSLGSGTLFGFFGILSLWLRRHCVHQAQLNDFLVSQKSFSYCYNMG